MLTRSSIGGVALRILFLGDIVGEPGRRIVGAAVPLLRQVCAIDLVVANAENAAAGSGLTPNCFEELVAGGVDAATMGDHIYKRKEIYELFGRGAPICKPANYPPEAPGPDHLLLSTKRGVPVLIVSVLGRVFMRPVDCPFRAIDRVLEAKGREASVVLIDIHAEATSDKQLMLRHCQGRASAVLGTHTHVPTADAAVYPPGTAYISDLGMTGPYDGIIGRQFDRVFQATYTFEPASFTVADGDPRLSGAIVDVDEATGRATSIEPIHLNEQAVAKLRESQTATT